MPLIFITKRKVGKLKWFNRFTQPLRNNLSKLKFENTTARKQSSNSLELIAVSLVSDQVYSKADAAKSLSINATMLGRWGKEHQRLARLSAHIR
jgi:hypothetical protein